MADGWQVVKEEPFTPPPWLANPSGYIGQQIGAPVRITSGGRSAAHNAAVGGVPNSAHLSGDAFDFVPQGMSMDQAAGRLAASGIQFDQIINEGDHIHVSFAPAMRSQVIGPTAHSGSDPWRVVAETPTPAAANDPWKVVSEEPISGARAKPTHIPTFGELHPVLNAIAPAIEAARPFLNNANARTEAAGQQAAAGVEGVVNRGSPLDMAGGVLNTVGGVWSGATAPLAAAADELVGKPVNALTHDALTPGWAGDALTFLSGFVGGAPESNAAKALRDLPNRPVDYDPTGPSPPPPPVAAKPTPAAASKPPTAASRADKLGAGLEPIPHAADPISQPVPVDHNPFATARDPNATPFAELQAERAAGVAEEAAPGDFEDRPPRALAAEERAPSPELAMGGREPDPNAPVGHPDRAGPVVGMEADPVERVDNALYRLGTNSDADKAEASAFLKAAPKDVTAPKVQEELYHAIEEQIAEPGKPIPEHLAKAEEARAPWRDEQLAIINRLRERGDPDVEAYIGDTGHVPRRVQGYSPLFDPKEGPTGAPDPILGKRALTQPSSAQRARTAGWIVVDMNGEKSFTRDKDQFHIDGEESHALDADGMESEPVLSIRQATSREVEENTDIRYHANALINTIDDVLRLRRVERNLQVLDELKQNLKTEGLAHQDEWHYPDGNGGWVRAHANTKAPDNFLTLPQIPQLEGWSFDPKIAEALADYFPPRGDANLMEEGIGALNRILIGTLFMTPVPHSLNVWSHWAQERSWDWINPVGFARLASTGARAMKEVFTMGPKYRELLREGSALLYASSKNREFYQLMLQKAGHDIVADPQTWGAFVQNFGLQNAFSSPADFLRLWYKTSNQMMWYASDVFMMQRVLEEEAKGISMRPAIAKVEKGIPNYRVPPRIKVGGKEIPFGRLASKVVRSRQAIMFGRYRHGVYRALGSMFEDLVGPKATAAQRVDALGKFLVTGVMAMGGFTLADWGLKRLTGNDDAEMRRPGGFGIIHALAGLVKGEKDIAQVESSAFSLAPLPNLAVEWHNNRDYFGRKVIEDQSTPLGKAVQAAEFAAQPVYPVAAAINAMKPGGGAQSVGRMVGVDLPPPGAKSKQRMFRLRERKDALKREQRDPLEKHIRDIIEKFGKKPPGNASGEVSGVEPAERELKPVGQ